jgi:glycosyltransferase involved in cell wall biosynthesis
MNVLFFINTYPNYGGVERVTSILANEFSAKGHRVSIVSFNQIDNSLLANLSTDINFYPLSHPVISKKNIEAIREILIKDNIGHIINQWCLPFYTTLLCRLCLVLANKKAKIYATLHNPTDDYPMTKALKEKINQEKFYLKKILLHI